MSYQDRIVVDPAIRSGKPCIKGTRITVYDILEPRAHLDIETDSIESEVVRLERLRAAVVSRRSGWVVMQAPTRHRFCVGNPYRVGFDREPTPGSDA